MICPKCGKEVSDAIPVCELCGAPLPKKELEEEPEELELEQQTDYKPKPFMGFVGALLGATVSSLLIMLLAKIGLTPSFGGLVIAFCVFIGSGLLNRRPTKIGFGVCIMFIVFTPYIADRLIWAMKIVENAKALELPENISLLEAFLGMPILLDAGEIPIGMYMKELFNAYIFTAIGTVAYLAGVAKGKKKKKMKENQS